MNVHKLRMRKRREDQPSLSMFLSTGILMRVLTNLVMNVESVVWERLETGGVMEDQEMRQEFITRIPRRKILTKQVSGSRTTMPGVGFPLHIHQTQG